jgi:hypothetical protein
MAIRTGKTVVTPEGHMGKVVQTWRYYNGSAGRPAEKIEVQILDDRGRSTKSTKLYKARELRAA